MEPTQILIDLIEKSRFWLAVQPRFDASWSQGCRWILGEMDSWIRTSLADLLPSPIEGRLLDDCRVRVWSAWSYHWHEAIRTAPDHRMDGANVADMLRRGERPGRVASPLGGDPIRDAILVEACLLGCPPAYRLLRETYSDVFLREAQRVGAESEAGSLEEEVWDRLDPIAETSRRWLERYCGYSSLRTFLRIIVRHRLVDSLRSRCARRLAERTFSASRHARGEPGPIAGAEMDEFRAQVRQALLHLPEVEQKLLILRYLEGLPNGVVARKIGLSGGQTSRLHGQAVVRLRDALKPLWQEDIRSSDQGYSLYAQFLFRGLSEALALQDYSGAAQIVEDQKEGNMALIHKLQKRKKRQETSLKGTAAPAKKASTPFKELLPPPPRIDLDGLIPDAIAVAVLGNDEPEDVFAELRNTSVERRPGVFCLDARGGKAEDARAWLDKFDSLVHEQDENSVPDLIEMQMVMFVAGEESLKPFDDLITRPDIDWVLTEDRTSPLTRLYTDVVQKDLTALLSTNPYEGLHSREDKDFRPVEYFLPEEERKAWREQLREMGQKEE